MPKWSIRVVIEQDGRKGLLDDVGQNHSRDDEFPSPISSAVALDAHPHDGVGQYVIDGQGHTIPRINADSNTCNKPAEGAEHWHGKYIGHG